MIKMMTRYDWREYRISFIKPDNIIEWHLHSRSAKEKSGSNVKINVFFMFRCLLLNHVKTIKRIWMWYQGSLYSELT